MSFKGIQPTKKKVEWSGIWIYRVANAQQIFRWRHVMGTRRPYLVPEQFGTLQGVRILFSGRCPYTLCR